jgi:hypothetical protein
MVGSPTAEKNPKGVKKIYSTGRMYDGQATMSGGVRKTIRFSPLSLNSGNRVLSCHVLLNSRELNFNRLCRSAGPPVFLFFATLLFI